LCLCCSEFDKISENLQSADSEIDWLRKELKPIYSSNVQGLLRTKIEAGEDNCWLPYSYFLNFLRNFLFLFYAAKF